MLQTMEKDGNVIFLLPYVDRCSYSDYIAVTEWAPIWPHLRVIPEFLPCFHISREVPATEGATVKIYLKVRVKLEDKRS